MASSQAARAGSARSLLARCYAKAIDLCYGHRDEYVVQLMSVKVRFATDDDYSRCWFYPRYAAGRVHERPVTEQFLRMLARSRCFADVGTNLGWYTCFAGLSMRGGLVYGFEMDELNFQIVRRNVTLNGCENVSLHNVAVSDRPGRILYHRPADRPSPICRLASEGEEAGRDGRLHFVEAVTLDQFFTDKEVKPDLVKIDVEGAELKVLSGMINLLERYHPTLFIEVHPRALREFRGSVEGVLTLLSCHGYRVFEIAGFRGVSPEDCLKPLSTREGARLRRNAMLYAVDASDHRPVA